LALLLEFLIPKKDNAFSETSVTLVRRDVINPGMIVLEIVPGNVAAKIPDAIIEIQKPAWILWSSFDGSK